MSDVPYWVTSSAAVNASLKFANEIWNSFTREVLERLQLPIYLKCPRQCLETLGNCCDLENWFSPHRWWSLQCKVSWVPCVKGCSSNAEDFSPWMTLSCIYSIVLHFILTAVMVEELSQNICLCSDFFFCYCLYLLLYAILSDHLLIYIFGYLRRKWCKESMHKAKL